MLARRIRRRRGLGPATYTDDRKEADRGSAVDLDDAKTKCKAAWARIRASLTEQDITDAHRIAEISAEVLARYNRKQG